MSSRNAFSYNAARTGVAALTISLAAALAACGGDGGGEAKPAPVADNETVTVPLSFGQIFLKEGGAGYYEFTAGTDADSGKLVRTGYNQLFVNTSSDKQFGSRSGAILGKGVSLALSSKTYITEAGAVTPTNLLEANQPRIFQALPGGYQGGINEISAPLYEITIAAHDVSGQPLGKTTEKDKAAPTNGLAAVLGNVDVPLPAGSLMYQSSMKVLATNLQFFRSAKTNESSLEQAQAKVGGTIGSLGGYRYLAGGTATYIDDSGVIYVGQLLTAGEIHSERPAGYNTIAAEFIAQQQVAAGLPKENPPVADDPVVTDPVVTDPVVTDPVVTDPVVTDPVVTDPVVTVPVVTVPVSDFVPIDPVVTDPVSDFVPIDPVGTDPVTIDPIEFGLEGVKS